MVGERSSCPLQVLARRETGRLWQAADRSGAAELLYQPDEEINEVLLSPDEKWLIYRTAPGTNNRDIFSVPMEGDRKPTLVVGGPSQESHPRFSPDGKWLAYQSDERGRFEMYVRPFPGPGARVQVSNQGGAEPVWSRSGRRIYYRTLSGGVESADVTDGTTFTVRERRTVLASGDYLNDVTHASWDIWPDESAFLMVKLAGREVAADSRQQLGSRPSRAHRGGKALMSIPDRLSAALADRYRIERELGGGGMSRVFLAREQGLNREVVIKVLSADVAAGVSLERFRT